MISGAHKIFRVVDRDLGRFLALRGSALVFVLAVSLAAGGALAAQALRPNLPWFGLALPPGLGDPHRPVVNLAGMAAPPARVPSGEEGFSELKGERIRKDVETIVGFSKQSHAAGDRAWGRVTGFPAAARTMTWVAGRLTPIASAVVVTTHRHRAATNSPRTDARCPALMPAWYARAVTPAAVSTLVSRSVSERR